MLGLRVFGPPRLAPYPLSSLLIFHVHLLRDHRELVGDGSEAQAHRFEQWIRLSIIKFNNKDNI